MVGLGLSLSLPHPLSFLVGFFLSDIFYQYIEGFLSHMVFYVYEIITNGF